ncbi:MAG: hypothetical protein IAC61_00630 [Firmicutes bacterium]|uniref:Uncharacterized protein n=1 Tax=Candidatus Alloenteromonas pullistercoris TaxID=2840785 RepID=A0A9D9GV68_9FIRM|nr:hypothetical protein [Candidatus Enteromonas pullistercoris]
MKWGNRLSIMAFALCLPLTSAVATYGALSLSGAFEAKEQVRLGEVAINRDFDPEIIVINSATQRIVRDARGYTLVASASLTIPRGSISKYWYSSSGVKEFEAVDFLFAYSGTFDAYAAHCYLLADYEGSRYFNPYSRSSANGQAAISYYVLDQNLASDFEHDSIEGLYGESGVNNTINAFNFTCSIEVPVSSPTNPGLSFSSFGISFKEAI